ncbi:MAG: hypothetical protein NWQ17_09330 [Polaribacter sp.]|nr:hypothetical protein [Polaribacter sp.]
MKTNSLSAAEQSVLNVVQKEPLTSFEILKRVDNVPMILSLYNVLDDLRNKGIIKSFIKENKKYHCAS